MIYPPRIKLKGYETRKNDDDKIYLEWNWMFIYSTSDIYIDFLIIRFAEWYDHDYDDGDDCYYFNKYRII